MAIVRTVLSTGLVQSQHGSTGYEQDQDANMVLLNTLLTESANPIAGDLGLNGVANGFALSTSSSLTPGLAGGTLYAQGTQFYSATGPTIPAAPATATNYLFYNGSTGFYWQTSAVGATAGDALIGKAVTSGSAVTAVTQATKIFGTMAVTAAANGNFTVQHLLGRAPIGLSIRQTSSGQIWFQTATDVDTINLYLVASVAGATAKVTIW